MPFLPREMGPDFSKIAEGTQKKVYTANKDLDKKIVFAEYMKKDHYPDWFKNPNFVKSQFYFNKILHQLFPNTIPEMRAAFTEPRVDVIDKIELDDDHKQLNNLLFTEDAHTTESKDRILDIKDGMEKEFRDRIDGIDKQMKETTGMFGGIDTMIQNFGTDDKNNLWYLDSIYPWVICEEGVDGQPFGEERLILNFQVEKIRKAINTIQDDHVKEETNNYLECLLRLAKAECKERNISIEAGEGL